MAYKQADFTYSADSQMTGVYEYGWQIYPSAGASSGLTLAGEQLDTYDHDGRLTGLTDEAYGGDYGGTWVGNETVEQYTLAYDTDSRINTVYNSIHTSESQADYYDADSQLAAVGAYGGSSGYGGYAGYGGYGSGYGSYGGYSGYGGQINYTDYDANGNPDTSSAGVTAPAIGCCPTARTTTRTTWPATCSARPTSPPARRHISATTPTIAWCRS